MIYFNSDYLEGAHPYVMEKLNETNMVQTVGYGEDEYCEAARERIKAVCQAPEADVHFLVGGTQTNTTVIASILRPWQGVLSAVSGHINCHEAGAIESTGHKVITLPTANGKITARQVQDYVEWHKNDESTEHIVQPGMVYISHPTEGGTLYTKAELTALYDTCRRYGLPLFIDGARLGYGVMADGAELTYGGRRLRCILTPGHTPGHLCLYEPERRWLFCGDHVLFHITPNICRWSGVRDSLGDYLESLERVKELPVERLLPAHRAETGDLRARAEELRLHHLRRLENALDIVRRRPGLTAYDIAGEMRWSIRCRDWGDFPVTQKFFAVGEALSHLDYLEVRGLVERRSEREHDVYFAADGGRITQETYFK